MNYEFPLIRNISDVLPAIDGRDEFVVADKGSYTVINYNVMMADTFPPIVSGWCNSDCSCKSCADMQIASIRRECRGLIFCNETGAILRRPFSKFFNVNEREETRDHVIDMSRPHAILEKLDGSMIAPFIVNDKMIWGTKMGATDVAKPVEEFVKNNRNYIEFADALITRGFTPIFEWCSRKQRIVLDYSDDQLILTAVRSMNTGEYASFESLKEYIYPKMIPVVRAFEQRTDMKAFLEYVRDLEDLEGFVVRFDDGHMLKLKCHWYIQIHKAKEAILHDRNIVELILEEHLDDVKAHLPAEDRDRLTQFESDINKSLMNVVQEICNIMYDLTDRDLDRKTFALEEAPNLDPFIRPIVFKNFDGCTISKIMDDVRNTLRNNLGRTAKYEAIREAWFPGIAFNV